MASKPCPQRAAHAAATVFTSPPPLFTHVCGVWHVYVHPLHTNASRDLFHSHQPSLTLASLALIQIAKKHHYHTVVRLLNEYGCNAPPTDHDYNSNSDAEMLSSAGEMNLPRPHQSKSPALRARNPATFDFKTVKGGTPSSRANNHGSVGSGSENATSHAPNTPSAAMFSGLDTFEVQTGNLVRRQESYGSYGTSMSAMSSPSYGYHPQQQHTPTRSYGYQQQQQQPATPTFQSPTYQTAPQQYNGMASARDAVRGGSYGQQLANPSPSSYLHTNVNYHSHSGYASDTVQSQHYSHHSHNSHNSHNSPHYVNRSQSAGNAVSKSVEYNANAGYASDASRRGGGYASDTGHRHQNQPAQHNLDAGYSSDAPRNQHLLNLRVDAGYNSDAAPAASSRALNPAVSGVSSLTNASFSPHEGSSGGTTTSYSFPPSPASHGSQPQPAVEEVETDPDAEETFYMSSDKWNVYESEEYPYYLRMHDNHSQWDDPRTHGVEGEEPPPPPAAVVAPPVTPAASFYKQPVAMVSPVAGEKKEVEGVEPYAHPGIQPQLSPPKESLMSPTMTSASKAGVGATFIKVNQSAQNTCVNAADAKQTFLSAQPIHAETKNAPLRLSPTPAPQRTAEEVFAEAKEESFAEAKEEIEAEEETKEEAKKEAKIEVEAEARPAEKQETAAARPAERLETAAARETATTRTKEELAADPDLAKFVKQAKMGVPPPAIANKMISEGIHPNKINDFRRTFGLPVEAERAPDDEESEEEEKEEPVLTKEELAADPDLTKFVKQAKMGVPPPAIVNKMRGEGVAADKVEKFERTFGLAVAKTKKKKPLPSMQRRTTVKMQKVHWNAVDESKLQGSVWGQDEEELGKDDIQGLEGLFGEAKLGSPKGGAKGGGAKKAPVAAALVDGKRAYNVNIGLAQFKSIVGDDYDALMTAVAELDGDKLGQERVSNLKAMLPTKQEVFQLEQFSGDETKLGKCERFFLAVARAEGGTARIGKILGGLSAMLAFDEGVSEVEKAADVLSLACGQIVESNKLKVLFKKVLAVGNLMNESVGKPTVSGITLDSLIKTAELKGKDKKTTVLDYVVKMIGEKGEDEGVKMLSGLAQEMSDLAAGARCMGMKEMLGIVGDLQVGIRIIEGMLGEEGASALFRERGAKFVQKGGSMLGAIEKKIKECGKKVRVLCEYFAEDFEVCNPANIMKVLQQFIRLVGTSWEMYQRKARALARNAVRSARAPNGGGLSVDTGGEGGGGGGGTPQRGGAGTPQTPQTPQPGGGGRFNQDLLMKAMQNRRTSIQGASPDVAAAVEGRSPYGGGMTSPYGAGGGERTPLPESKENGADSDSSDDWLDAKD